MNNKENYAKTAKKCISKITLSELPFWKDHHYLENISEIPFEIYVRLVLASPSKLSNIGTKISKRAEKHIDEIVNCIVKNLNVKSTYFFSAYESKDSAKENLSNQVVTDSSSFLYMYVPNGFLESLYASIRNALAHGNILKVDNFYYLYSVSPKEISPDSEKPVTFLLKIHKLSKLDAYITAFEKFN